jgi:hypothetical protein
MPEVNQKAYIQQDSLLESLQTRLAFCQVSVLAITPHNSPTDGMRSDKMPFIQMDTLYGDMLRMC